MLKTFIKKNWGYALLLIFSFVYLLGMNLDTQLFDDDLYINGPQTLSALYNQAYGDYMGWNGRAVGQTFWRILVANQGMVTSLLVSAVSILFLVVATKMAKVDSKMVKSWQAYLVFFATFLFFAPVIGQTMFWRAGAGNYLFTTTLILLFVLPFYQWYKENPVNQKWGWYLMPVLGFVAGWSNENTSGGGLFLVLFFMLVGRFYKQLKWTWMQLISIIFYLVGYGFLVSAPGNKVRTHAQMPDWWFEQSTFTHFKTGFIAVTKSLYHQYLLLLALLVILTVVVFFLKGYKSVIESTAFFAAGMATIYVLSLAPIGQDGGRSFFGGVVFLLIALVKLLLILASDLSLNKLWRVGTIAFAALLILGSGYKLVRGTVDAHKTNNALRERYVELDKLRGSKKVISVKKLSYYPQKKFAVSYQLEELNSTDSQMFPNSGYNIHYDLKGIVLDK
ncbi:DUF6056 family protein [Fructobacillus sp. W13]|uniref:DUF6056 family protein n=1 Tax=Fructobacillus apis TaxID=2935017 RepID=A0ABT0ZNW3_9LACO|nr:DUF6056 family protein [Fructobacillus apis]MCO0831676.1 DUF6056 family protein [Fructobacillus apis]